MKRNLVILVVTLYVHWNLVVLFLLTVNSKPKTLLLVNIPSRVFFRTDSIFHSVGVTSNDTTKDTLKILSKFSIVKKQNILWIKYRWAAPDKRALIRNKVEPGWTIRALFLQGRVIGPSEASSQAFKYKERRRKSPMSIIRGWRRFDKKYLMPFFIQTRNSKVAMCF